VLQNGTTVEGCLHHVPLNKVLGHDDRLQQITNVNKWQMAMTSQSHFIC